MKPLGPTKKTLSWSSAALSADVPKGSFARSTGSWKNTATCPFSFERRWSFFSFSTTEYARASASSIVSMREKSASMPSCRRWLSRPKSRPRAIERGGAFVAYRSSK